MEKVMFEKCYCSFVQSVILVYVIRDLTRVFGETPVYNEFDLDWIWFVLVLANAVLLCWTPNLSFFWAFKLNLEEYCNLINC